MLAVKLACHLPAELDAQSTTGMRNHVRELRTERGLSQGQLAVAVSVSRQTINSIEQGRYAPSLPLAIALARYFGARVEELFDASD
jgi:putative transcriptional regulator